MLDSFRRRKCFLCSVGAGKIKKLNLFSFLVFVSYLDDVFDAVVVVLESFAQVRVFFANGEGVLVVEA